jgi:hypothetical protein
LTHSRRAFSELDRRLAGYLIPIPIGSQLQSSRELAEAFDASLGSISAALNHLEKIGAVTINRRGRMGSFLEGKSTAALWSIAAEGPMVIALTLPSFPKCEGLATAIYSLLNSAGIETYLTFIRGSFNRIKALKSGLCHAAVVSALTADALEGSETETILRLPPQTFVTDHRVFFRSSIQHDRPLIVGIDYDSYDIKYLTELEFADSDVQFQQMPFTQTDLNLERSSVDAAISNADHLSRLMGKEFSSRPLSPKVQAIIGDRDTSAAVLVKGGDIATKAVLTDILRTDDILHIQQKVVEGLIVPRY